MFKHSIKQFLKLYKYVDVYRRTDVTKHGGNEHWERGTERKSKAPPSKVERGVIQSLNNPCSWLCEEQKSNESVEVGNRARLIRWDPV